MSRNGCCLNILPHICALRLIICSCSVFVLRILLCGNKVVSNSIDAGATCVEIKLDLPSHRLSIADNGRGIPAEKLQSLIATARGKNSQFHALSPQHTTTYEHVACLTTTTLVFLRGSFAVSSTVAWYMWYTTAVFLW